MPEIVKWIGVVALCAAVSSLAMAQSEAPEPDSVQSTKSFKKIIKKTVRADYLLFVPAEYPKNKAKKWPLILFLHGAGERGKNIWLVAKHGPPRIVRDRPSFPFVVVSPQCPAGRIWDQQVVLSLLDEILMKYRVDPSRVYLTGLSMGGYGTWDIGLAHPERFAALVPICGGGNPIALRLLDKRGLEALKILPIWAFHGAKDTTVRLSESERMVEAVKRAGGNAKLTVYPNAGHDSWTESYNNPELYEWLLGQSRTSARHP